jgi:hypothetical protein
VAVFGEVVFAFARLFSYAEIALELRWETSKRKMGMPRLSRRPNHCGYYEVIVSDASFAMREMVTKRRVSSNSSVSILRNRSSMPWSFRQSSVVLNCLKASAGTKRRARRKRLWKISTPPLLGVTQPYSRSSSSWVGCVLPPFAAGV